ncbi:MAG: xanthine dehydrogenase family protein subunit M, partial [Polyangia bacterium]|nr:xanthine dehydrogenase family protein subunit M [Polyangia bacterium]
LGPEARFLAGGTELLADLKQQRDHTPQVISLASLSELAEIRVEGDDLWIGAAAKLQDIAESPLVLERFPALPEAILKMAARQIRHRASIGGNFCGGVPSADTPPICIAGGASCEIAGPEGKRAVSAEAFFKGVRKVDLRGGEVLAAIRIPSQGSGSGACYQRFQLRRATALAVAGVAARVLLDGKKIREARLVLGAVAPVPLVAKSASEWLAGRPAVPGSFEEAGRMASAEARPISDLRGSDGFRRGLVETLTARALLDATARAR